MNSNPVKPDSLPQINSAPFKYMIDGLKKNGVGYKKVKVNGSELKPMQGVIIMDKVSEIDPLNLKPIWLANNNSVLDGHHRLASSITHNVPITGIRVNLCPEEAIEMLKKIQELYKYEKNETLDEVIAQDQINAMNEPHDINELSFLAALEAEIKLDDDGNKEVLHGDNVINSKKKTVKAYRKDPIKVDSKSGNYFSLKPVEGYRAYSIQFDNLLDTNDMNIIYHGEKNPVMVLSKYWFPHVDFEKISRRLGTSPEALANRAVAEKARSMNFDGVKYGDIMVQGL